MDDIVYLFHHWNAPCRWRFFIGILIFNLVVYGNCGDTWKLDAAGARNASRCNSDTEILCDDGLCVLKSLVCDGVPDCNDGTDEPDTCAIIGRRPCTIVEFRCQNQKCIPLQFICNGQNDCRDSSDEMISDCQNPCHVPGEFHCPANPKSNSCFPSSKRCDGVLDCVDGRDEILGCDEDNATRCADDQFTCPDGKCLSRQSLCNHFVDCFDGSDEMNCGCDNATEMECRDKSRCIYRDWRCDGTKDCQDGSDEENCLHTNVSMCQYPDRPCSRRTAPADSSPAHQCMTISRFCDGVKDCDGGEDEGPLCDKKQCATAACINGTCRPLPDGSSLCLCDPGFDLEADNQTCKKIDRCAGSWGVCSQKCVRTDELSGYHCDCLAGFKLSKDKFTCHSTDNRSAFLIFSSRHEIRMIDLRMPDIQPILVPSLRNTIAIDFLYDAGENGRQLIFWSDVVDDKIYSGSLVDAAVFDVKQVVENSLPTAEGIAVDWIGRNLYWVESTLDQIEVSRVDGQYRTTIIAGNITNPRAIVLDPQEGMLFWTDWDPDYPRIESASMAGQDRTVLVNISAVQGGRWPNGLAIDFEAQPHRLYWIDAYSDAIHAVTVHGLDIREVVRGGDFIQHPFAVAVYGSHVYWTDWRTNSVHKANKWNGSDIATVTQVSTQPFDVHIVHSSLQPKVRNPCAIRNGGCSHLCLIGVNSTRHCACPHLTQFKNGSDSQCQPFRSFMLFSRTTEIRGVTLDKSHHNFIPAVINVQNATTMDVDVERDQVYWVDAKAKTVVRACLNGTHIETVVDSPGGPRPTDIAIDWISRTIFIAFAVDGSSAPGEISVSTLSGEFRKALVSDQIVTPISVAISPLLGKIVWADIGHTKHRIEIASANGQNRAVFADEASSPDFRLPKSLTFGQGPYERHLYWISKAHDKLQYCVISGGVKPCLRVETLTASGVVAPLAISYFQQSLLIGVGRFDPAIGIFNLTTATFDVIRPDTPSVVSVKMFSPLVQQGSNACSYRNGNCSQLCLPDSPTTRTCNCTAGYLLDQQDEAACVPLNSTLLFSIASQIHGIALDPTQPDELLPRISRISMATSLDFEAESSYIYWVDPKTSTLNRIRRDLTGRQVIVEDDVTSVENIAVDWMAGNIYWTNPVGKTIEVSRLNGSSRFVVAHEHLEQPKAIAVHPAKGFLFWSDNGGKAAKIERASLDGSSRISMYDVQRVTDMTIDYEDNKLYWCDAGLDRIERSNLDFTGRTVLLSNASIVMDPVAIVVFLNYIYWTDKFPQRGVIYRADKSDPRSPTVIRRGLNATVNDILIFSKDRQKGKNICSVNNGGCEELCFFSSQKNHTCACAHGILSQDGRTCDAHTSFLLYSRGRSIESAHLLTDSTNKNDPIAKLQNSTAMINVIGLAFDYDTSRIFYSDIQKGELYSVLFNGTDWRTVATGVGSAEGLAFDIYKQELYWTSYNNASIFRIFAAEGAINQVAHRVVQLTVGDKLRNLAIDACKQKLYWTNWNKDVPSIQRVSFDGEDLESIITTDIKTPNAIAIDHRGQYLFWADALLDKIERARLDGTERKVLLWDNVRHPFALTVHGDHIYWTDWIMRAVVGANKYTGQDVVKIRENLGRQPMGIIAVSNNSQDCRSNPCLHKNGGCSEICYPSEKDGLTATCHCFNNRTLLADGVSCEVGTARCAADQFRCGSGKCIPLMLTCDMRRHCDDGSDEDVEYCTYRTCPTGFISCKTSRKCVPESLRCNRRDDCGDGSDEVACVCDDSEFRCKSTGDCIKTEYRCDGEQDCGDSSDEIGCHGRKCETTPDGRQMSACPNSAMCYLPEWVCDGDNDCGDNYDEQNCTGVVATTPLPCSKDSFRCANGIGCIPNSWRCDGESDCLDHSDEENCSVKCPADSFECSDGSCIPMMWKCDGVPECPGGSDEAFELCHQTNCSQTDFRCLHSGLCIPGDWRCDGEIDCGRNDSSDETEGCETISRCSFNEFRCRNNRCIPGEFICDGEDDCGDFSDEAKEICGERNTTHDSNMTPTDNLSCLPPAYKCKNGILCINESLTCDNKDDCGDLSDEIFCDLNDCLTNPCGPNGKCLEKRIGYECQCQPGYAVSNKTGECVDYNECDSFPCSHFCYNTIGSYRCVCSNGYTALDGGRSCKAVSDIQPTLLYSNKHFIRNVSFKGDQRFLVRGNLTNAVALDFEWSTQCLYWSDVTPSASSINKWCIHDPTDHVEVLHAATVHNPDGIAVDWIAKNLYWCDKGTDTIEVSRLDGGSRKVLLKEGLQEPRALVVDPHHGYLYWSDWGHQPHIGKMGMDGSNVFRLQLDRTELGWPNAMTIDYVTNTIFWADARFDYIAMADLNLQHRRRVLENSAGRPDQLRHVFALSVFEDSLFWTDWETKQIHRANKFSGANMTSMDASSHRPMDIQVFHPFRQLPLSFHPNPCEGNNECSNLCLLKPTNNTKIPVTGTCACPDNYILEGDGKKCQANCSAAHFVCQNTFKCIPKWWKCDGQDDCGDGFDEPDNCGRNFTCTPGEFQCTNGRQCLHPTNICDGIRQCSDGSDEDGSIVDCSSYLCLASQFKCPQSHHCIPRSHVCDGRPDCKNGEDEKTCPRTAGPAKKCTPLQYECKDGSCISQSKVCDEMPDCKDRSDESPSINCTAQPCGRADMFRCLSDGICIPDARRCDGMDDCADGSDEKADTCGGVAGKCDPAVYFVCNDTKKCISHKWVCDDEDDCSDGSDELNCTIPCGPTEFSCDDHCIDLKFKCDGEPDCRDLSDEANCTSACPDGHMACADDSGCISEKWKCDGVIDCPDASDESHCDHNCAPDEHTCKNKKCIVKQWLCDGEDDCGDRSDEDADLCSRFPCFPDRFRCNSGTCILQAQKCDGHKDCQDGSDEASCASKDGICRFRCANGRCLTNLKEVCDGVNNCGDNSDEDACRLNPCTRYGHCSQRCLWDGDVDNYTCVCDTGYRNILHGKNKTCLADGPPAFLLLAEQNQLRSLDPYHRRGEYRQLMELKDERISFLDVDMSSPQDPVLYWSSRENHVIYKQNLPKKRKERADFDRNEPLPLISSVQEPRGVAVDWVNDRLFWIDGHTKQIEVAFLNGTMRTPILTNGLAEPYDLVVDPESGFIIWSDISGNPRIERARFDGSDREVLAQDNLRYPTGLAIDYANRRLYWADPKIGSVETMTVEGKDRRRVKHSVFDKEKPYNVDVFEDQLFVSTSKNNSVFRINKFGLGNATVLAKGLRRPATILIVQEKKQNQQLPSLCGVDSCPVGMLCVAVPPTSHRCICAGYATYNDVTKRCEDPVDTSCKPPCQNGGKCLPYFTGTGYGCRCPPQFTGPTCAVPKCSSYCYNNGNCTFNGTTPKCSCEPPFTGDRCQQNMCTHVHFCENGGNCSVDAKGSLVCACPSNWVGKRCDIPRHECTDYCRNSGSCVLRDSKPRCICLPNFSGDRCTEGEGECGRCHNRGICFVDKNGTDRCRCKDAFKGEKCEECDDLQCNNNGVCVVSGGKARCNCTAGYSGQKCEKDLCKGFCKFGTCIHGHPPRCNCPLGKTGDRCQNEHDCPCRNNGTCGALVKVDGGLERRCKCVGNFYGKLCEFVPNCEALACMNGGRCQVDPKFKFRCDCPAQWTGSRCESEHLCHNFCQNGGTCLPPLTGYGQPTCICPMDFMGLRCDSRIFDIEPPPAKEDEMTSTETAVTIGIPLVIILILLLAGAGGFAWKRRSRGKPFQHILMEEVGGESNEVAISNPMFLKDETEYDDEDVLHPDKVAFANPIYESCFYNRSSRKSGDTEKAGLLQLQDEESDVLQQTATSSTGRPNDHVKV